MHAKILADYHAQRTTGARARDALAMARHKARVRALPYVVEDGTQFQHGRFTVTIGVAFDNDVDLSWLGRYTDHPTGFAFNRQGAGRNSYQYFEPAADNGRRGAYRVGYQKLGYSKHDAYLKAVRSLREDWELMEKLNADGMYTVSVTVSLAGTELGHACIGNVDREWVTGAYLEYGLLAEALEDAKRTLNKLCAAQR